MHQNPTTQHGRTLSWGAFLAWAVAGAIGAFALVTFPTLGIVLILVVGTVVAITPALRRSVIGVLAGVGAISVIVAYVQRHGPETVCWHTANASGCDQYLDPRPWLVAGVVLVLVSLLAQTRRPSQH